LILTYSSSSYWQHQARCATILNLPQVVGQAVDEFLKDPPIGDNPRLVDFVTGDLSTIVMAVSDSHLESGDKQWDSGLIDSINDDRQHPARKWIDKISNQDPAPWFEQIRSTAFAMDLIMENLPNDHTGNYMRRLYSMVCQGPTQYHEVTGTRRFYADGGAAHGLYRSLRKEMFVGCWELDFCHCQLTILANMFQLPILSEALNKETWWSDLAEFCGVSVAKTKVLLKKLCYSAVFGMSERTLRAAAKYGNASKGIPTGLGKGPGKKFMNHPAVKEMIEAIKAYCKVIEAQVNSGQEIRDCYDRVVAVPIAKRNGTIPANKIMSRIIQALELYELELLLNQLSPDAYIFSCLHDGITVKWPTEQAAAENIEKIQKTWAAYYERELCKMRVEAKRLEHIPNICWPEAFMDGRKGYLELRQVKLFDLEEEEKVKAAHT
ncbi:MAG: hypothetical protein ACYC0V_20155, partial [Armatimonadota bacterium]